jgi:hypothetical protein
MRFVDHVARLIGSLLILAVLISGSAEALPLPQEPGSPQERQDQPPSSSQQTPVAPQNQPAPQPDSAPLPDSPGQSQAPNLNNDQIKAQDQDKDKDTDKDKGQVEAQPQTPPPSAPPQPGQYQKPVGTAAAESSTTTGYAASKPAGEALAPGKQKRTRTILISVGAVVAAAMVLGIVVGLSKGTPSKPPGAQ